jgi:general secretion pathway protein E
MDLPHLPYSFARQNGVVLDVEGPAPACLVRPDAPTEALAEVIRVAGPGVIFRPATAETFAAQLSRAYRDTAADASVAASADRDLAALAESTEPLDDLLDQSGDAPVVRLINAILLEAIRDGASDVHFETQERRLSVRFRIDGLLQPKIEPKRALAPLIISRIKVMARLDIAEKRLPQDGRVSLRVGGHEVDIRVSTIPSQYGERVVLRLLNRDAARLGLDRLGMRPEDADLVHRLLARPDGILLVTGPTGSGKTTTLYAALDHLNERSRNIMTVEDPIEYALDGVAQMQVNPRIDLSFARGLRALLRQDPDVIMVGEIRDRETAQVAIEAAMTGHLVLSTLHTNTAVGAVARLVDMGVERFLLAPVLAGVFAQRLVRCICADCRTPIPATAEAARLVEGLVPGETIFHGVGCPSCQGSGYRGRTGLYELVEVTDDIEALIQRGASEAELTAAARRAGPGLVADGLRLIRAGITTPGEVARVANED